MFITFTVHFGGLRALFVKTRNTDAALKEIKAASKNKNEFTWAYSMAFLLGYKGDLNGAYRYYQIAFYNLTFNA